MSEQTTTYELTETAKEELDFECSDCGTTEFPEVVEAREVDERKPSSLLVDYILTVECVECGRQSKSVVWERDVQEQ